MPRLQPVCLNTLRGLSLAALLLLATDIRADELADSEKRLAESAAYLASDALEGRGVGTEGLVKAGEYIAKQFADLGLKTNIYDGGPFQKFMLTTKAEPGKTNTLTLLGPAAEGKTDPQRIEFKLQSDFSPLGLGESGVFDAPLVFVGYGITAKTKDLEYDDFAGVDVKDKAVIILRKEPQQNNPHSLFDGTRTTGHALYTAKLANAVQHGAKLVIFVNDNAELTGNLFRRQEEWMNSLAEFKKLNETVEKLDHPTLDQVREQALKANGLADELKKRGNALSEPLDRVLRFDEAQSPDSSKNVPVVHCRREFIDQALKSACGVELAQLEKEIDEDLKPRSRELPGWKAQGEVTVVRTQSEVRNVVAVLEGEGPLAEEAIVVGAHYDHLGLGGAGSLAPNEKAIHNGADDNASGVATLVEVARLLAAGPKLPRKIVFVAFTAEEMGLIGSSRYVKDPAAPLDKTIAMLNMDMVGRLKDEKLIVFGTGTADTFDALVDRLTGPAGFKITKKPSGYGPSDHQSFYVKQVPVIHLFTDTHGDYHRPSDDIEKLNVPGMRRVGQLMADMATAIAQRPERPKYIETQAPASTRGDSTRPYFGSVPDFANDKPGYALAKTVDGSPAHKAGLKGGDVVVKVGDNKIDNLEDFDAALRKFKPKETVPITVIRDGKEQVFPVTLGEPR